MSAPSTKAQIFAEDLAERFGLSLSTARRRLVALEQRHGTKVVGRLPGRRGIRRYTTEAALESIGPAAKAQESDTRAFVLEMFEELRGVQSSVDRLRRRIEAIERGASR